MIDFITDYYHDEDSDTIFVMIMKFIETQRIQSHAKLIKKEAKTAKSLFDEKGKTIALNTKSALQTIENQIDTAIQGEASDSLKEKITELLPNYDSIFE